MRPVLLCTVLACAAFVTAGVHIAKTSSATFDEVAHIAAGAMYLQGDLRLNREHPPLAKALAALALPAREPALALPAQLPTGDYQWQFGSEYLYSSSDPVTVLLRARLPLILLNCGMLISVALLGYWVSGRVVACTAVLLAATCPTWLAHAALVTTDAPATTFFAASITAATALSLASSQRSRLAASSVLAVSFALGDATKYSMLGASLFVTIGALLDAARARHWWLVPWITGAALAGTLLGVSFAWGSFDPAAYLAGVRLLGHNHASDHYFYAFGTLFRGQDYAYFARALLVKVSLPTLALAFFMLCAGLLRRRDAPRALAVLVVPALGYLALMSVGAPATGVRYVLPVLPLLFVAAGSGAARLFQAMRGRIALGLAAAAQASSLVVALEQTPLAFFNGLLCRTGQVPPCLDDSNVDWGQALPALKTFCDAHYPRRPVRLFYIGSSPPDAIRAYVPQATSAQARELLQPQAALYAISLHKLVRATEDSWTRKARPVAVVGGAYAIYDLAAPP